MRHDVWAIGWEFRRRYSWPLVVLSFYMLALLAIKLLGLGPAEPIRVAPPDGRAAVLIAPLSTTFMYYLGVFSYGFAGDLAARQSILPARLFTLPVRTEALVLGPMLHGTAWVAGLVFAATLIARWPWGIDVPIVWPALLAAVSLAWTQALTWLPYGVRGARVVLTVLSLTAIDVVVIVGVHFRISEPAMIAFLAPQLPVAYLVARYAVARARRGDVPDWLPAHAAARTGASRDSHPRERFASAARAQAWFEWRRQGRALPAALAMILPFQLALLWLAKDAPGFVAEILIMVGFTPPVMAAFATTTVSKASPDGRDALGVAPFIATRPVTSPALITAKLTMTLWSTLATWALVLGATVVALTLSGTWPAVTERAARTAHLFGTARAVVLALLILAALMAATWKQLVQSLCVSLTGRAWLIRSTIIGALVVIVFIAPVAQWVSEHKTAQAWLFNALPAILAALVAIKLLSAAWVAARLAASGILRDGTMMAGAAAWTLTVFALYGLLAWIFSGPLIARYFLLLVAMLFVPLARLSAAPLALAWNRHR